ncbi:MAG TPA: hypothetical protein P5509_11280 [Bacteroidales bacterium]|nr:hypothetical protein [Bacteroidales bacterium]
MARKKQNLDFTFILKLNKEDRDMLNELQEGGLNMSQYFRLKIREIHKLVEDSKIIHRDA